MANERKDTPKAAKAQDVWRVKDEHTAHDIEQPREDEPDMKEVAGFTRTGQSGSSGGRVLHGIAPDDLVAQDAARNERIAEGNLQRGAPVAEGRTGGNALTEGQTEPPVEDVGETEEP